jgi:cobalt-zinc-cadmium efflux system outer membrane protein
LFNPTGTAGVRSTSAFMRHFVGALLSFCILPAMAAPLTLEQAWQLAEQANPALRSTEANIAAFEGAATDARATLWNNPQLSGEMVRRQIPSSQNAREWNIGIAQTFELAGQQGYRRAATQQELAAAKSAYEETRRQLHAEVEKRFVRVLGLQSRIGIETDTIRLIQEASEAVQKRVRVGEDTKLEGNLAAVEVGRANNQIVAFKEQLIEARADLATLLQLPPDQLPEVAGELQRQHAAYALDDLLSSAASRAQLKALEHRSQAAQSRLALERAAVYPDVTLGLSAGQEGPGGARENLTGLSVSVPLPLFRRNATGIGRAMADLTQVEIEKAAAEREAKAQVIATWRKLESLQERVRLLNETIFPSLEENQRLATKAFNAGEIGLIDLLVVSRQAIDGRRDGLDALIELAQTRVVLEQAAGWPAATSDALLEPQPQQTTEQQQ